MSSPITKLPDGSAFFTATVMSKEEAMALPLKERPLCHRISSELYHAVFEAIGSASMCWNPRPSSEVFHSEEASKVAVDLCFKFANELESKTEHLEKALALKLDAMPSGLSAGQSKVLEKNLESYRRFIVSIGDDETLPERVRIEALKVLQRVL